MGPLSREQELYRIFNLLGAGISVEDLGAISYLAGIYDATYGTYLQSQWLDDIYMEAAGTYLQTQWLDEIYIATYGTYVRLEPPVNVEVDGITISQTPTVTVGAYADGDAVGGLLTFANAARVSGGGGVIKDIFIIDDAGEDAWLELWLFNQTFTAMSDNAPWAPTEADLENCIGVISTADSAQGWLAAGTPSVINIEVAKRYDLTGTSLFGQLVTRGTPTFANTDDVTVKVGLLQD